MAPNEIGLVVRGHVMRRGGAGTLSADGNDEDLQLVLHSIRINAASPSTSIAFVAVDVVWLDCTAEQAQQLRGLVRSYLNFPHSSIFVRVSKESLGSTQTASLLQTLSWLRPYANCLDEDGSILFLRCDCILKSYFQVDDWIELMHRQDTCNRSMLFPFYVFKDGGPADQIFSCR